ncbi:MAG: DNA primase [Candidatus Dormiibacterota bacterium]
MAGDAVAEVKSRLDLVEVIGGYVTLHRAGRELTGLCPFHAEKTPSFTVSPERQVWYCHGCHEGGDLFKFIEQIERIDFRQALEMLADRAGVELESGPRSDRGAGRRRRRSIELNAKAQAYYQHVLWATPAGEPGRNLLRDRGVEEAPARRFGVGFAPAGGAGEDALARYLTGKGGATVEELVEAGLVHPPRGGRMRDRFRDRLVFPIRDERGEVLGFGARALGDAKPKYLNSPDSAAYHKSAAIFGLDLARTAIVREHAAVIVEGYFDVLAAHAAGVEHTVASSGTALTREQVHSLGRIAETLVLCFDGDDAGRVAATRAVDVIAVEGIQARICRLPAGVKDPDELVHTDPAAFARAIADAPPAWQVLLDAALGTGEGGSVDARRAAAERAVSVLARIPEATTRELYLQQAARRLDLGARSLSTDLAHSMRDGIRKPARIVVAAPADPAPGAEEPEPIEADEPMPPWEAQLARVVLIRPELAAALRTETGLGPDEFTNPTARRIYDAASTEPSEFTLRRLTGGDQRRAAGLLVREVPEFADAAEPQAIKQLMADCVRLIHEESVRRALVSISAEMHRARDEGRTEDADALAAKLSRLAADAPHLRRTVAVR